MKKIKKLISGIKGFIKKLTDTFVFLFCMTSLVAMMYLGICYLNIVGTNLNTDGCEYPSWNILATTIENAGQ